MSILAGQLPEGWVAALADLVGAMDGARFPSALRQVLALCCQFDSLVITRYAGTVPPQALFHDLDDVQAAITVAFYATGPYLLDPFYHACRNRQGPGVYRLRDITAEGFFRSEYYRSFYRRTRISDEIALLIPNAAEGWITLSLARRFRRAPFTEADAAALKAVYPLARGAVLRQWGTRAHGQHAEVDADIESRLALFAADQLSPREAEVVQLILSGHSTHAAADALGISPGTVKVHRRHAYAKLNVGSQSELFSLATRFLMAQSG
ncbi:MAG: helix-turn-helix transcriptional regulator [Rhodobacteraceae bacterium]|jgi:DNA-binding CsgD family transcriptional regulator|uniref:helix-turn-helix transcriptional regulator n=1 Tax=Albidovulum sp. TaxID=1872424 RepID=UPI001E14D41B|nr:helix-turn-helix transcriptional regulator [uncultured Defluviimonas sp.]MCB2125568.1 helix-turn-helix transcriptional regulator [Paracoccaceae bacterium]MCC0069089.1 helix-turn-helix transcriptional regulator [Paracoccaceae bacterium]